LASSPSVCGPGPAATQSYPSLHQDEAVVGELNDEKVPDESGTLPIHRTPSPGRADPDAAWIRAVSSAPPAGVALSRQSGPGWGAPTA